jgi:DNA primase
MEKRSNTLLYGVIEDILGKPKKHNHHRQQYSFDCPTCSAEKGMYDGDGKGNFEVNLSKGVYHCWACGETHKTHGSIKKLIKVYGHSGHRKKLKQLGFELDEIKTQKPKEKNVIEDLELPESFVSFAEGNPKDLEYKQAWNYITKERKVPKEIIEKYKIGYTTEGKYGGRIILPSYDNEGNLNYWVGRTYIKQKPKYLNPDSDKEEIIFNECCLNWDSTIYIVEGPFDHIVVHNSIPILGKKMSDKLMKMLFDKATENIVVLLDADGWRDSKELYAKLNVGKLNGRVRVVKLKDEYDIAKVQEDFGRQGVIQAMKSSFMLKESLL